MKLTLQSTVISRWIDDDDPFAKVKAIDGIVVRSKEGRTTQRFEIDGEGFYAKLHEGIGWWEVVKNLLQLRLPVIGASNEWNAIKRLRELGVDTLTAVAYGKRGINPAAQTSFLITEELTGTLSLADYARDWQNRPPPFVVKRALIAKVAEIASAIHDAGINHRDLYICHFLVDLGENKLLLPGKLVRLFLVDLHRAQLRSAVPRRWLVKDVGSIYFSAMDIGLTRRDIYRFLQEYYQLPLRRILTDKKEFLASARRRAIRLYQRDFGRSPKEVL